MDAVDAALATAFPDRNVRAIESTGPSWNEANKTVQVRFADDESVYLKIATDGDGTRVARERAVTTYVSAKTAVNVPTVLAAAPESDPPYLVTAPVDGEPILDRWDAADAAGRQQLAHALGRSLARLHAIRFDGHGRFEDGDADALYFETQPWADLLAADVRYMREAAPTARFPAYYDDLLAAIETNRERLSDVPAALLHGDPARPNCFLSERRIGLLDWERAHAGDPARELYRAREQALEPLRGAVDSDLIAAYRDGYRSVAGALPAGYDERRPVYEAIRLTGPVGFFEQYLEFDTIDEAAFTEWLKGEMERRLAALK